MQENLTKALSVFSVGFFIVIAISLFFMLYNENIETINIVNDNLSDKGVVCQTVDYKATGEVVSGAALTGSIKNGLETDILIDSIAISKVTSSDTFDFSVIDNSALYSAEYVLNELGEITMVKYQKR